MMIINYLKLIEWNLDSDNSTTLHTNQEDDNIFDKDDTVILSLPEKSKSGEYDVP